MKLNKITRQTIREVNAEAHDKETLREHWLAQKKRPRANRQECQERANKHHRQAAEAHCRASELLDGRRTIVRLSQSQRFAIFNFHGEDLSYIICSDGFLEFRPDQLFRWYETLGALKVLRPSQRRTIDALGRKLHKRAAEVKNG